MCVTWKEARCFCLAGALLRVGGEAGERAWDYVEAVASDEFKTTSVCINDRAQTVEPVLHLLDRAIAKAERKSC